ncbi:hypothetical protein AB0H83_45860 [Dactylosporangium sp. NPDC050688]|uniref:hypothetical protein n=1 Tax=Dactylosporangium sp. NPDC050688 TaxID=3157217 RepID=UPI0033F662A6
MTDASPHLAAARAAATTASEAHAHTATRFALSACHVAALLTVDELPDAASLTFDQDEDTVTAETTIELRTVRAADGRLLWFNAFTGYPVTEEQQALGDPPPLDADRIAAQLLAAYDADADVFSYPEQAERTGGDAVARELDIARSLAPRPGRVVTVTAPHGERHDFTLTGDDTITIDDNGTPLVGFTTTGAGWWPDPDETWEPLTPGGHTTERWIAIEAITTEAMWRDLEHALGLRLHELGRFKQWWDGARMLDGKYDLDAAIAWARRHRLPYEEARTVRYTPDVDGNAAAPHSSRSN